MKNSVLIVSALAAGLFSATPSFAAVYSIETYPDRDKCYLVEHVPATVEVNTKGVLIQGETKSISGGYHDGGVVVFSENPAVYMQTQKTIEKDHITLVPTSC